MLCRCEGSGLVAYSNLTTTPAGGEIHTKVLNPPLITFLITVVWKQGGFSCCKNQRNPPASGEPYSYCSIFCLSTVAKSFGSFTTTVQLYEVDYELAAWLAGFRGHWVISSSHYCLNSNYCILKSSLHSQQVMSPRSPEGFTPSLGILRSSSTEQIKKP